MQDAAHERVILPKKAKRIISLAPDITEILFSLGVGQRIVGVIQGSDYPLAATHLPQVGSYNGLDLERIIALKPDLIVTWNKLFWVPLQKLKAQGIAIYTTNPKHLEDIPQTMLDLGCLVGEEAVAQARAQQFLKALHNLKATYEHQAKVKVFYQIGADSLMTVNAESWINDVIQVCGGENIYAHLHFPNPIINLESLFSQNPEVIVSDATMPKWQQYWQKKSYLYAVKHHLVFRLDPNLIDRAGPRLIIGAKMMCADLQQARLTIR